MDVILLDVEFNQLPMFPLADGFEDSSEFALDLVRTEYFTTVFGSPDQVIFEVVETV